LGLVLRRARVPGHDGLCSVALEGGRVAAVSEAAETVPAGDREADLEGRWLLPALVNAHDVLDAATLPPLGRPPYRNLSEWTLDCAKDAVLAKDAMRLPLHDRLFLGGLRNLLCGAGAVVHHEADHRSLGRDDFPVRVQRRYGFALAARLPRLRQTYRTTDRRIPWFVRAAAGIDEEARGDLLRLVEANVLRHNTVIVHGTALGAADVPRLAEAGACVVWCPEADERLFGAQPPIAALRAGGVPLALGSGSAGLGGRDLLSALAAARRTGLLDNADLLELVTAGGASVARLPPGGARAGAEADLLVVRERDQLLAGERTAVSLVIVAGRPLYGERALLRALEPRALNLEVDGAPRAMGAPLLRRLRSGRPRGPSLPRWLEGVML
jgi:cytosine/adenosine deaminase-related metal-dependent hydrolase